MGVFGRLMVTFLPFAPRFVVRLVAKRYMAGESLEQAIDVMESLSSEGACFTVDVLGEEISSLEESSWFIEEYERVIDAISERDLDASISIKPTALGLLIDEQQAHSNIERIVRKASETDTFVRLDMEDHRATQATIDASIAMHSKGLSNVGVVLQGRMFRTMDDIRNLCKSTERATDFRICKAYIWSPPILHILVTRT